MKKPRVLIYDIETSYLRGPSWGTYDTNLLWVDEDWHMLSFAYKWLGEKKTHVLALPDFKGYNKNKRDDSKLVEALWELFNEADVLIAHNGDKFDQRKSNARFIINGLLRPQPYHSIDTLKVARKYFAFTSNKLDDLGEMLGCGRKLDTGGKYLWKECIEGNMAAWNKMKRYNKQDVVLLEKVYLKLLPWMDNHPAMNVITGQADACPKCGAVGAMQKRGYKHTKANTYQRYQCTNCKGWCQSPKGTAIKPQYTN